MLFEALGSLAPALTLDQPLDDLVVTIESSIKQAHFVLPEGLVRAVITAWLRGEIMFENEPLERVAAEFNRYAPKPIEIATPALRSLQISGVFATDDTDAFIAFLRSLKGVRVEITATRIRVSQE